MSIQLAVLGGGESGTGAALLAKKLGLPVFLSEKGSLKAAYKARLQEAAIIFEENGHSEKMLLEAKEWIVSPGIPDTLPLLQKAREIGISIIDEIEFAFRFSKGKAIAITGSNGKTTTTHLIYHLLQKAGLSVGLAGNVGHSWAAQLCSQDYDYWVLELSSFQLDRIQAFRPYISVLLNITPDHLDRYHYQFERYAASKFRICQNQEESDAFIYNADDPLINEWVRHHNKPLRMYGFSLDASIETTACINENQLEVTIEHKLFNMTIYDLALQGKHNAYNSMAAAIAGNVLKIRKEIIRESLSDFQGVEHRLEYFLKIHGIQFINDSKATNVNATWYALESMSAPTIWIVGGVDKGNDYSELFDLVKQKVKAIICLGTDNAKLLEAFSDKVEVIADTHSMEEAVNLAYSLGKKGDHVLLSPACASFDLFDNYEARGRAFKKAVRDL